PYLGDLARASGVVGTDEQTHAASPGGELVQDPQALCGEAGAHHAEAGDAAARLVEAGDEAALYRVVSEHKDDRGRRRRILRGADRGGGEMAITTLAPS